MYDNLHINFRHESTLRNKNPLALLKICPALNRIECSLRFEATRKLRARDLGRHSLMKYIIHDFRRRFASICYLFYGFCKKLLSVAFETRTFCRHWKSGKSCRTYKLAATFTILFYYPLSSYHIKGIIIIKYNIVQFYFEIYGRIISGLRCCHFFIIFNCQ